MTGISFASILTACLLLCNGVTTRSRFSAKMYWGKLGQPVTLVCDLSKGEQLIGFYDRSGQRIEIKGRFKLKNISSDNSYQLTIDPVLANDFGEYACKDTSNDTSTTMLYIEAWIENFQLEYFGATGDTAKLQVNTGGYPSHTVVWKKIAVIALTETKIERNEDGTVTSSSPRYTLSEDGSLLISGVSESDVANYRLTVSNGGEKQSNTTSLKVGDKPTWVTRPPAPFNVSQGTMFEIKCEFRNKDSVKWTFVSKEGQTVQLVDTARLKIGDTGVTVSLATRADEGHYRCTASNKYGTIYGETSVLYVIEKGPILVTNPLTVEQNKPFQLWCNSSGHPSLKFTWYHNDVTLKSKEGITIKEDALGSAVLIDSASPSLVGTYKCHVYYGNIFQEAVQGENTTSIAVRGVTKDQSVSCPLGSTFVLTNTTVYCRCQDGYVHTSKECRSGKIVQVSGLTLGLSWTPQYSQRDSVASLALNRQLNRKLQGQTNLSGFLNSQILRLEQGSVIVLLLLVFDNTSNVTAAEVLAALQKFLQASDQTEPKFLPSRSLEVKESTLCDISGMACWPHSECTLVNNASQYNCVCMNGYSLKNNNQCVASNQISPTTTGPTKAASTSDKLLPLYCVLGVLAFLALVLIGICYKRKGNLLSPYSKQQSAQSSARSFPQLEVSREPSDKYSYADSDVAISNPQHKIPETEYYSYPNFENRGVGNQQFNREGGKTEDPVYRSPEEQEGGYQELQERKEYKKPYPHYESYRRESGDNDLYSDVNNQEGAYALYDASARKSEASADPGYALYDETAGNYACADHRT